MDEDRYRQIKKKVLILKNRKPYTPETASYIEEMNRNDWITSCLRLSGTPVSRENVERIAGGELLVDISLKNHQLIHRYAAVMREIQSRMEMETDLTEKGLFQLYEILFEPQESGYRRENPVILEWSYNPPHFNEVEEEMKLLFQWLASEEGRVNPDLNPVMRAVMLHNRMIAIYPFGERSGTMARLAMLYELSRSGYPPIQFELGEQEYNGAIALYLKKEDSEPLYDAVEQGVYRQLELMIQLTSIR